jgi:hypothetical protein
MLLVYLIYKEDRSLSWSLYEWCPSHLTLIYALPFCGVLLWFNPGVYFACMLQCLHIIVKLSVTQWGTSAQQRIIVKNELRLARHKTRMGAFILRLIEGQLWRAAKGKTRVCQICLFSLLLFVTSKRKNHQVPWFAPFVFPPFERIKCFPQISRS